MIFHQRVLRSAEARTPKQLDQAIIEKIAAVRYHEGHVWRVLGKLGFSCQRPERRAIERDDKEVRQWRSKTWLTLKNARRQRRLIVFVDESGLSTNQPTHARAPGHHAARRRCSLRASTGKAFR